MKQNGQALILLIVAAAVALTVITSAILAVVGQARSSVLNESGSRIYFIAESASDQAMIKLIRSPYSCPPNENFTQDTVAITIQYAPFLGVCAVTTVAQKDSILKKIVFLGGYDASPASSTYRQFNICCWKENP